MPKKRTLTSSDQKFLAGLLTETVSKFLLFRSIASSYFCKDERIRVRTERLLEDFDEIRKELNTTAPK